MKWYPNAWLHAPKREIKNPSQMVWIKFRNGQIHGPDTMQNTYDKWRLALWRFVPPNKLLLSDWDILEIGIDA